MPKPFSFGKVDVGLTVGSPTPQATPMEPGSPFRIAILGDFSGRGSRGQIEPGASLPGRKAIMVDRDNFDEVLAKMGVELQLPASTEGGAPLSLQFTQLDDFRPERLVPRLEVFERLRQTRRRLGNPSTFADAAEEVRQWAKPKAAYSTAASPPPKTAASPTLAGGALLDQILGETRVPERQAANPLGLDLDAFVREVVAPYAVAKADPRQAELTAAVDEATGAILRAILHHSSFQALEAAWRSLHFLVRRLETDAQLKLFVLDISRAELAADLSATEDLRATGIYRLLVEQTVGRPGAQPWAVLQGNYAFGASVEDVELLGRLARIAQQAGAPFVAGAGPALVGCDSFGQTPDPDYWQASIEPDVQEAWQALRGLPEARYLGLVLPRFLVRLPYGKDTDPVEGMTFEELPKKPDHESYLWGNPAFLCTYLLAETYSQYGWSFRPGVFRDVDGLPLHVRDRDGEPETTPCAEAILSYRAATRIAEKGLMPLLSMQGMDAVRLDSIRSVVEPATPLAGRWS